MSVCVRACVRVCVSLFVFVSLSLDLSLSLCTCTCTPTNHVHCSVPLLLQSRLLLVDGVSTASPPTASATDLHVQPRGGDSASLFCAHVNGSPSDRSHRCFGADYALRPLLLLLLPLQIPKASRERCSIATRRVRLCSSLSANLSFSTSSSSGCVSVWLCVRLRICVSANTMASGMAIFGAHILPTCTTSQACTSSSHTLCPCAAVVAYSAGGFCQA